MVPVIHVNVRKLKLLFGSHVPEASTGRFWEIFRRRISPYSAVTALLQLVYPGDGPEDILSDESWDVSDGHVRFLEIIDGEIYDDRITKEIIAKAVCYPVADTIPAEKRIPRPDRRCAGLHSCGSLLFPSVAG